MKGKNTNTRNRERIEKNTLPQMQEEYCFQMNKIGTNIYKPHWLELVPVAFFTAVIVLIVFNFTYKRDMSQFTWISNVETLTDLFSYCKMIAILCTAVYVLLVLLYRLVNQKLAFKKSLVYIFAGVYCLFVITSFFTSDYKDFALLGYNDRFEGTLVIIAYMIIFIYMFNTINTPESVKWVVFPLAVSSVVLSIIGISQFYSHDFFKSQVGQKLITKNIDLGDGVTVNDLISNGEQFLDFKFDAGEIYQTVYNPNYVSFYLTLLIPLFGMLFVFIIKNEQKKWLLIICSALLFALIVFNFLGSASTGGLFGLGVAVLVAIAFMNIKLKNWIKPLIMLVLIACVSAGLTYSTWGPEVFGTLKNSSSITTSSEAKEDIHSIESIDTEGNNIYFTLDSEAYQIHVESVDMNGISVEDSNGKSISLTHTDKEGLYEFEDPRFEDCSLSGIVSEGYPFVSFTHNNGEMNWIFLLNNNEITYMNTVGNLSGIKTAEAGLFKNNLRFGSGRGYIWSRSIPLMKSSIIVGTGADTFCLAFPQTDYVGKYNAEYYSMKENIIVDKPHNMYLNMFITTGGISFLAFMGILILYFVECFRIYRKVEYDDFLPYCGFGIFIGIIGFAVAGLVNDSSVSVMPMFYGLLATGYAINVMLRKRIKNGEINAEV